MVASIAVRQDQFLSRNINPIDEKYVYDESSSQSDELSAAIAQLVRYQVLDLSKLE